MLYLRDLGITSLYTSPLFKARRWSLHGNSVPNLQELNPELGCEPALDRRAHPKLFQEGDYLSGPPGLHPQ